MEAAGALRAAAPILESISNPPGGAGWSWEKTVKNSRLLKKIIKVIVGWIILTFPLKLHDF